MLAKHFLEEYDRIVPEDVLQRFCEEKWLKSQEEVFFRGQTRPVGGYYVDDVKRFLILMVNGKLLPNPGGVEDFSEMVQPAGVLFD